jgi:hypothetical protein
MVLQTKQAKAIISYWWFEKPTKVLALCQLWPSRPDGRPLKERTEVARWAVQWKNALMN